MAQNDKNSAFCTLYLWSHTSYDLQLWYIYVKRIIYLGVFLHILQILIFLVNSGVKAKNDLKWQKIMSATCHIWVSVHHMIVFFGVQVWNDDISRYFSHFFKVFIFWIVREGWEKGCKGKKWSKITKNSVSLHISETVPHFFKILIFQVFQSWSINAKRKFWGVSHLLHMCVIFEFKS